MTTPLPRILLVEPQFVLRRTIAMVARDLGVVDFHEASNVGRAQTLLASEAYDGLVLDLAEAPQAMELLDDLRQGKFATPLDVPVVVLATDGKSVEAAHLQALGVACVLAKPVRISDLLRAIADAREQRSASINTLLGQRLEA